MAPFDFSLKTRWMEWSFTCARGRRRPNSTAPLKGLGSFAFSPMYKENRWDPKQLIGSGGMPSSHSATVTALAMAIGFQYGFGCSLFATTAIFASVVMYDASGIRLHAGKQAEVLNQIVCELPSEHPLAETRPLRELLSHTPNQVVAGTLIGFMIAAAGQLLL